MFRTDKIDFSFTISAVFSNSDSECFTEWTAGIEDVTLHKDAEWIVYCRCVYVCMKSEIWLVDRCYKGIYCKKRTVTIWPWPSGLSPLHLCIRHPSGPASFWHVEGTSILDNSVTIFLLEPRCEDFLCFRFSARLMHRNKTVKWPQMKFKPSLVLIWCSAATPAQL